MNQHQLAEEMELEAMLDREENPDKFSSPSEAEIMGDIQQERDREEESYE